MDLIKLQQKISAIVADFIVIREQLDSTTRDNEDNSKAPNYAIINTQIDFIKNNIEYLKDIINNKHDTKPLLCGSCIERSASLEELENIYRQAPIGLCVYDSDCTYLRANNALANYSGLQTADQLIGKSVREIVPGIADDIEYHVSHVFQTGEPIIDVEVSGDVHSFPQSRLNSFHPLFHHGTSHVKSVSVVIKDITELKKHEISLLQQKRQVEEANSAKSSFLSHVSHELRTPMNCILGMIKFILDSDLTIDQFECASAAYQSAASMMSLLNDLLDLSKIEAGKFQAASIPFQLLSEIEKVVDTFSYKLGEKRLHLYTHYDMNLPNMFIGDPGRIRQIVLNLVGNAIKFTEEGHITITVRSSKENEVVIEVEDTGCGIPSDQIALIFREFEQGEVIRRLGRRNSDVTHRSTGLGLTITEQFVKAMHGRIEVQSRVSQGSKFAIFLPLRAAQSERVGKLLSKKQKHLDGKNIHIISSNDLLTNSLTKCLLQVANVNIARSKSIDDLSPSTIPDLVLLDTNYENWLNIKSSVVTLFPNTSVVLLASLIEQRQILPTLEGLPNIATTLQPIKFHSLIELSSTLLDPTLYRDGAIKRTEKLLMSPSSRRDLFTCKYPGLKVLIAEDNKINQIILERLLKSRDCQVDVAVNGSQAVELAVKNKYDIIFMDCEMPIKDGYTATKEIRECESVNKFSPVKIVAVTAHAMSTDKDKCLASGMDSYLVKPIDTNELDEILQDYTLKSQHNVV